MKAYQRQFIEFALEKQVLKFGEFTLKSGRKSPYFFNAGLFNSGRDLARLGRFYAAALMDAGIEFDVLFGPAYKGIPIASATAVQLVEQHDVDVPWCFNRKEAKDHGEGGNLVGSPLKQMIAAVSVGMFEGEAICDLEYIEDSAAETDMNVVMTEDGRIIEVQGTAEAEPFTHEELLAMLALAKGGIADIIALQKQSLS